MAKKAKKRIPKNKYCRKEDVNVRFPGQPDRITVQRLPMPKLTSMPAVPGGFVPLRLVVNIKFADTVQPKSKVLKFDPPLELHLRYYTADIERARAAGGELAFGYWDGTKWIRFTKASHKLRLIRWEAAKGRGVAVVDISEWSDPPVAAGK